jgi:hypothetical protein
MATVRTRCQDHPRLPRQRWCRQCLTTSQKERRAVRRAAQAAAVAPLPATQQVRTEPHQPTAMSAPPSHAVAQALAAYRNAELAYYRATRCIWPRRPLAPDLRVYQLWRHAQVYQQR